MGARDRHVEERGADPAARDAASAADLQADRRAGRDLGGRSPEAGAGVEQPGGGHGAVDVGVDDRRALVPEVDEAVGPPAAGPGDLAPLEVATPVVLGHEDLVGRHHPLDVGDVSRRGEGGVPPGDRPDGRVVVGLAREGRTPVVGVAGQGGGLGVGQAVLDEAVGDVVRAVVPRRLAPVARGAVVLVARVRVAGRLARVVAGAQHDPLGGAGRSRQTDRPDGAEQERDHREENGAGARPCGTGAPSGGGAGPGETGVGHEVALEWHRCLPWSPWVLSAI